MRAALHRAAKTGNSHRGRALDGGRRRAHRKAPRSGRHASRWCVDELPERAPRLPRLRAERRARRKPFSSGSRVGPSELYGYDAHGNIAFLTDGSGVETDRYTYDAWGNLVASSGGTTNTRLYSGEEFDPDLGVINLRARQYRPGAGRFWTIDPATGTLHQPITFDRYLYANGDPVNGFDPSGRTAIDYALFISTVALASATVVVSTHTTFFDWCSVGATALGGSIALVPGALATVGTALVAPAAVLGLISGCALIDILENPKAHW